MEKFLKEHLVERKNTHSSKWDNLPARFNGDDNLLAMWVADMEFSTAKEIKEGLKARIDHGVFGYSLTPDTYYDSFFAWMKKYHNVELKKDWIRFNLGVVNSIYHLINLFTNINDSVLIMAPVYYPFANSVKDNQRKLVEHKLIYNDKNGEFSINFEQFEADIISNNVKLMIFCSPHNPIGKIWSKEELIKILEICKKHNVFVISDEIHQDFSYDIKFTSVLALDNISNYFDNLVVLNAASKTFNLACLLNSHMIFPSEKLRDKYDVFAKQFNQIETSLLGQLATELAYKHARYWLENVKEIIYKNYLYIKEEFAKDENASKIIISPLEGTYLAFLNLNPIINKERTKEFIQDDCRIAIDYGDWFGKDYAGFIRVNLATDPKFVKIFVEKICNQLKIKDYR